MATIGERIKLARKQAGFTQEKLAKKDWRFHDEFKTL